ncbi:MULTISPECIES: magnesium transporter CorA family protein [Bacillaceae]|uniref:magnesium transporter CorA family protein n=1 Tax=Bacillaceae TaxID=186817 RepID=UPI001FDA65AB|nr:magnesium transporter CorA family protein [Niallia sp. SS-2023]MDL0435598.1 magnesium transporter CorA family protein [Niallia sp. SS-2023]
MKKYHMSNWVWYALEKMEEIDQIEAELNLQMEDWGKIINEKKGNYLEMDTSIIGKESLSGSLIYNRKIEERGDYELFYFFICGNTLITLDYHDNSLHLKDRTTIIRAAKNAESSVDGFMVILGNIMTDILYHIDAYEEKLDELIWDVKEKNSTNTLDKIYQSRHEILIWKNVMMPFLELKFAIEEAFGDAVNNGRDYKRVSKRIQRGLTLVDEYEKELNNLVHFEEVVSQHRGNEIMKTLTVFTALCTPIMALGALWGMNFKYMPELDWKYGYAISLALIVLTTVIIYAYLKTRGWMGDLLRAKKKNSFFQ